MKEALYLKYRPENFDDVIGQDHVVSVLQNSLKEGTVAHAYLLTGSRGIGKTTIARIIARALGTTEKDIYEIDAASNRGIDDIRELREGVRTMPYESKYKVYIIDEVHMLTKEAWNALLKTLEEPPAHVVFILATTEKEKVPDTVISRCQTFELARPTKEILEKVLARIAKKEKFSIDDDALELVAFLADGSFRDAQGVLQKVASYSGDRHITRLEVESATGAPTRVMLRSFFDAFFAGDLEALLAVIEKVRTENIDIRQFFKMILERMRMTLFFSHAPALALKLAKTLGEDAEYFKSFATAKNPHLRSATLLALLDAEEKSAYASMKTLPLEMAVIDILSKNSEKSSEKSA